MAAGVDGQLRSVASAGPVTHRLFFALRPPAGVAAQIAQHMHQWCFQHGVPGRPLPPERLHVTLLYVGEFEGLPEPVVDACRAVGAAAAAASDGFVVDFDRVGGFDGPGHRHPCVLLGGRSTSAMVALNAMLVSGCDAAGGPLPLRKGRPYTPHLTLLYSDLVVAEQAVEPLQWNAVAIDLMASRIREGRHEVMASWALGPASAVMPAVETRDGAR